MSSMPKPVIKSEGVVRPRESGYVPKGNRSPMNTERSYQEMPAQTASTPVGMETAGNKSIKNKP